MAKKKQKTIDILGCMISASRQGMTNEEVIEARCGENKMQFFKAQTKVMALQAKEDKLAEKAKKLQKKAKKLKKEAQKLQKKEGKLHEAEADLQQTETSVTASDVLDMVSDLAKPAEAAPATPEQLAALANTHQQRVQPQATR